MIRFKFNFFLFFLISYVFCDEISDKRLCIDSKCETPICYATTLTYYHAPDSYRLSFKPNQKIKVYSKDAGSNKNLWGVEIDGKRGYVPKKFLREQEKITKGTPTFIVDTELVTKPPQVPNENQTLKPTKVKENYDVIDGTTIYQEVTEGSDDIYQQNVTESLELQDDSEHTNNKNEEEEGGGILSGFTNMVTGIVMGGRPETPENEETKSKIEENDSSSELNTQNEHKTVEKESFETEKIQINEKDLPEKVESTLETKVPNITESLLEHEEVVPKEVTKEDETSEEKNLLKNNADSKEVSAEENVPSQADAASKEEIPLKVETDLKEADTPSKENIPLEEETDLKQDNASKEEPAPTGDIDTNDATSKEELPPKENTDFKENLGSKVDNISTEKTESMDVLKNEKETPLNNSETKLNEENLTSEIEKNTEKDELQDSSSLPENGIISNTLTKELDEYPVENSTKEEDTKNISETNVKEEEITSTETNQQENMSPNPTPINSQVDQSNSNDKPKDNSNEENVPQKLEGTDSIKPYQETPLNLNQDNIVESSKEVPSVSAEFDQLNKTEEVETATPPQKLEETDSIKPNQETPSNLNQENIVESSKEVPSVSTEFDQLNKTEEVETATPETTTKFSPYYFHHKALSSEEIYDKNPESKEKEPSPVTESSFSQNYLTSDTPYEYKYEEVTTENNYEHINDSEEQQNSDEYETNQTVPEEINQSNEKVTEEDNENPGIFSYFAEKPRDKREIIEQIPENTNNNVEIDAKTDNNQFNDYFIPMELNLSSDLFLYLITTSISVIIFLLGYFAIDRSRREGPLVAKLNKLEKEYLILMKEKELLTDQIENDSKENDYIESQDYINLQNEYKNIIDEKKDLEEQIQVLEKELENSTEVGLELNRMLSDILSSENAGETLKTNIEELQSQLTEQRNIVSTMKEKLSLKETENHELNLELDISNKKVIELQSELDKLLLNIIKIEEEKEQLEKNSDNEIKKLTEKINTINRKFEKNEHENTKLIDDLKHNLSNSERNLQLKIKEYTGLKETMQQIKTVKNTNTLESLLEVTSIKAELEQLKIECQSHCNQLKKEKDQNLILEKKTKTTKEEINDLKTKYDEIDKERLELGTKLEVLTSYFKERETQLQKELSNYESMWNEKKGEASSTSERIKYLQNEIQNYKSQNDILKQEIVSQEVELKSQISVLEKKVHENWVSARQAERRLEDLKQEAAQLRNTLTLRERSLQEEKIHNRMQSPLNQNGEMPISPLHLESPASPPLLFNPREHITKSPALLGMPLPPPNFLPPHGPPYLPPPHFMPPPPDMYPGDHRPPPLGRMSSPPLHSKYSPDSRRSYSPFDRRSPSPSYDDESEYGTSPVHHRRYSPFSSRNRRMPPPHVSGKINGRNSTISSGSGNSNESIEDLNHSISKV